MMLACKTPEPTHTMDTTPTTTETHTTTPQDEAEALPPITAEMLSGLTPETWPARAHHVAKIRVQDPDGLFILNVRGEENKYAVDWDNDGTFDDLNLTGQTSHEYDEPGTYTIRLAGDIHALSWCSTSHQAKNKLSSYTTTDEEHILDIEQWGNIQWRSMELMFAHCPTLEGWSAFDTPDLSRTTSMASMFLGAAQFNTDMGAWDTRHVTDMNSMFLGATRFNQPLDKWDTRHVTDMSNMFNSAKIFNQPLNTWDVSNVTRMNNMFAYTQRFNQPLDQWTVDKVTDMSNMFEHANAFNQPLNTWNMSNVTTTYNMFQSALSFNQPLDQWDVSNITTMAAMFSRARSFNQPLNTWDVSNVTNMSWMFSRATTFNQPLDTWNIKNVFAMQSMLKGAFSMSTENYDATLNGWAKLPSLQKNVTLDATGLSFCTSADARQKIKATYNWTIQGDHKKCP